MKTRTLSLALCALLVSSVTIVSAAPPVKQNSKCTKLNQKVTVSDSKFQCVKSGNRLVWKNLKPALKTESALPSVKPNFTVEFINGQIQAKIIIPSSSYLVSNKIQSSETAIYANVSSRFYQIGTLQRDLKDWDAVSGGNPVNLNLSWDLKGDYKGYLMGVEAKFVNSVGQGEKILKSIVIPFVTPSPTPTPTSSSTPLPQVTPTPTPTRTPIPSPTPTPSASSPSVEVGCTVKYLSALPFASQRIAVTAITWEKDAQGYVSALATMRNDNSNSLRLVEFKFSAIHSNSVIDFDQTLQGKSFFVKDDPTFKGIDGPSGPWLSGQSRTFRLPSNQMLECRSISVLSGGFTVSLGIGD